MSDFIFDKEKSTEENINAFFAHLETIDKELAILLQDNIKDMSFSDLSDTAKNQARRSANYKIAAFLDQTA